MTSPRAFAILAFVAPLTAAAQVSYSQATITGEGPLYYRAPVVREAPPAYADTVACDARNQALWDRKARLDRDRQDIDAEGARLDLMKQRLDDEFAHLDWGNDPAIRAYNARSNRYNQLIGEHNHRVARMNGAASVLNNDSQELVAQCGGTVVSAR
jgi:hypothetical protein